MSSPSSNTDDQQAPGLVAAMFRYWRTSIVIVVIAAVATYGVSLTFPTKYQASASVELTDPGNTVFPTTNALPDDFDRYTARQAVVIKSGTVAKAVAKTVSGLSITDYSHNVKVDTSTTGLLVVKARASTAAKAANLANSTTAGYQKVSADARNQSTNASLSAIQTSIGVLSGQFNQVNKQLKAKPNDALLTARLQSLTGDRGALAARANQILVNASALGTGVTFIDPARQPSHPVEPQPLRNAGIAALLALLVAGVLAWVRADRHQAADDSATPATLLDAPMLGTIPNLEDDMAAVSDGSSVAAESYQYVAASLQHLFKWGVLLVTSASRGDGKTVSAASIAAAAARDGTRVVLVDADARASTLTRRLLGAAHQRTVGLTDVAEGSARLDEASRLLTLDDGALLPFISAGSHARNSGLFRTSGMAQAFQKLRESYDLIVVDTAALLAVADVASLAANADGILVVVSRGTTLTSLESVRQRLDLVGAPLVGYVFTRDDDEPKPYLEEPIAAQHDSKRGHRLAFGKRRNVDQNGKLSRGDQRPRQRASDGSSPAPEGNGRGGTAKPEQVDDLL